MLASYWGEHEGASTALMSNHSKSGDVRRAAADLDADVVELADITERRGAVRRPVFKAGEVILPGGAVLPCIVRNVSDSGCLIKLEQAAALPDDVEIRMDLDKPARAAEVVWRSSTLAGAMFVRKLN